MSRRLTKLCLAGALLVSALVGASSASANWTTNGPGSVTFTSGFTSFTVDASGVGGAQGTNCLASTAQGDLSPTGVSSSVITLTALSFSICSIAGQGYAVKCTPDARLVGTSYNPITNQVHGDMESFHCLMVKLNGACGSATTFTSGGITFAGTMTLTYGNTSQVLTLSSGTPSGVSVSWNSTGCLQGTGTGSARATLHMRYGINSGLVPQITN